MCFFLPVVALQAVNSEFKVTPRNQKVGRKKQKKKKKNFVVIQALPESKLFGNIVSTTSRGLGSSFQHMHRPAVKIQGSKSSKFHMGQETSRHKKSCTSLSFSHLLDHFARICAKLTRNLSEK